MPETKTLHVVIADDELLARQRIEDLLAHDPSVVIAGTASNGPEAVAAIRKLAPDLVFLDVQMPGMTGFEVVAAIGTERMPVTIFVTAFDQFALKAFEVAAIDYLVKPFDDERFAQALARARKTIALRQVERLTKQLATLLHESAEPELPKRQYLDRIPVEQRGQMRVVPVSKIDYITASGPYAELHAAGKTFAVRERMQTLEEKLDPALFFRLHRSAIVRLDRIDILLRASGGDYAVRLKDGTELPLSRNRREELERVMGKG
ncbi:MAG TPA: LytTR family DNA-binding domain-containing protein [Thermoanaerobaculia bacterium]|jgi:two-component system LytT family response regulator|nr:LytTR family DNA-binding domain-containing protein [Thermoanaerobaculia bacterium]